MLLQSGESLATASLDSFVFCLPLRHGTAVIGGMAFHLLPGLSELLGVSGKKNSTVLVFSFSELFSLMMRISAFRLRMAVIFDSGFWPIIILCVCETVANLRVTVLRTGSFNLQKEAIFDLISLVALVHEVISLRATSYKECTYSDNPGLQSAKLKCQAAAYLFCCSKCFANHG